MRCRNRLKNKYVLIDTRNVENMFRKKNTDTHEYKAPDITCLTLRETHKVMDRKRNIENKRIKKLRKTLTKSETQINHERKRPGKKRKQKEK